MKYKVIITTSGIGSRLGNLTKYINKALTPIGNKYAICYILDNYPNDTEFIITLGYFGNQVKEFLELAYPDKNFTFVTIDKYKGPGSSLGYSLLQTKKYINCPFIYHACDSIIMDTKLPEPDKNWILGYKDGDTTQYSSFNVINNEVKNIFSKGQDIWDYVYVGVSGIYNYEKFFHYPTNRVNNKNNKELSDIHIMKDMINSGIKFGDITANKWYDIGNMGSLANVRKSIKNEYEVLEKLEESICFLDNAVIKFFSNNTICQNRVIRGNMLHPLTPKILDNGDNFYKYEFSKGKLLSKYNSMDKITKLLNWCNKNLWEKYPAPTHFYDLCRNFYFDKTKKRIIKFFDEHNIQDDSNIINNVEIPKVEDLLNQLDMDLLCKNEYAYQFHGDFIMDNILINKDDFILLDWRQDFGGDTKYGDIYYDLAKLKHNLFINHENVINNLFSINIQDKVVKLDIKCNFNLISQVKQLDKFIQDNGYNLKKVNLITSLIWLNISPLHTYPLSIFLFYFGKLNLYNVLNDISYI